MVEEIWLPQIDKNICIGCGDCTIACPVDALALANGTAVLIDPTACSYCADCETVCPVNAIALPYQIVMASHYDLTAANLD